MTTVLLIEDDADTRALLASRLERLGCRVAHAASGEAGLDAAFADPPQVAIIDVLLPGIDGWEVARRLRADPRTGSAQLVVTSVLDLAHREWPADVDVDDRLDKPFRAADVRALMRRLAAAQDKEDS